MDDQYWQTVGQWEEYLDGCEQKIKQGENEKMSVHKKLMQARLLLQNEKLEKTGLNKFAGFKYFELSDFLPTIQKIMNDVGLCGVVSFSADIATLTIVDVDDHQSQIVITSPMGSAALKGVHEVQNIGAVETYQRRYLWVTAFEIVEHDAIDAVAGQTPTKIIPAVPKIELEASRAALVDSVAHEVIELFEKNDVVGAYESYSGITDGDEKTELWRLLPSKVRSSIKKHGEILKEQK